MELEAAAAAGSCPAGSPPSVQSVPATNPAQPPQPLLPRLGKALPTLVVPVVAISLLLLAWAVWHDGLYTSGSDLGYWLGVVGGSLMLVLLIYPLRKRFRMLAVLGPLKHWFRFHLVAGIVGPLIVLFHSTFRIGSFNAAIALASMLLVVASGLVGRFLYRKIHHGLFGSRATAAELQRSLEQQLTELQSALAELPAVERETRHFSALVSRQPEGWWHRTWHFVTLDWKRRLAGRRVRRAIAGYDRQSRSGKPGEGAQMPAHAHLHALARTIDDTLKAVQRTAQFSTYEKLFSLWHVVHIPFLCMLVVTAIVHVLAVHAY